MRKFLVILILFSFTVCYGEVIKDINNFSFPKTTGKEVLILLSDKISTFDEVEDGIYSSLQGYNVYSYNFSGNTNAMKDIVKIVNKVKPTVLVVLGSSILSEVVGKVNVPIVFGMVINYKKFEVEKYDNITGVSLHVPLESVLFNLKSVYPNFGKVGVIASKGYYDDFIKPYKDNVKLSLSVEIKEKLINSSKEFISAYDSLSKEVDVMWMVPDTSVLDKDAIIYFINESFKTSKPTIVFSENFVKAGGFFSVSPNYQSIGSQIALYVRRIVEDKITPRNLGISPVVGTYTTVNKELAKKLNIDDLVLGFVDKIVE
ncbi:MAG: ABC transporter substrate-binding protein [Brevinematia bacterium]